MVLSACTGCRSRFDGPRGCVRLVLFSGCLSVSSTLFVARKFVADCSKEILASLTATRTSDGTEVLKHAEMTKVGKERLVAFCKKMAAEGLGMPDWFSADRQPLFSVCAVKNGRRTMEDRHLVVPDFRLVFPDAKVSSGSYQLCELDA